MAVITLVVFRLSTPLRVDMEEFSFEAAVRLLRKGEKGSQISEEEEQNQQEGGTDNNLLLNQVLQGPRRAW